MRLKDPRYGSFLLAHETHNPVDIFILELCTKKVSSQLALEHLHSKNLTVLTSPFLLGEFLMYSFLNDLIVSEANCSFVMSILYLANHLKRLYNLAWSSCNAYAW